MFTNHRISSFARQIWDPKRKEEREYVTIVVDKDLGYPVGSSNVPPYRIKEIVRQYMRQLNGHWTHEKRA